MNQAQQLLEELSFCVIDLETTGGNHSHDQIIEIGMVHIDKMQVGETRNYLINPKREIPEFIQKLTNITSETVADAPEFKNVAGEIIDFIGDRILVAHNSGFDVPFLNSVFRRIKKPELDNKVICTNIMTKHLIPEMMSSNLGYMSKIFNIEHNKAHRAIEDAIATAHLFIHYLNSFKKRNIEKVNQLYYPRNRFEIDRIKIQSKEPNAVDIIKKNIEDCTTNLLITVKGKQGIFKSILPVCKDRKNINFVLNHLENLNWNVVTIRQIGTLLDAYLFLNTHLYKLDESIREEVLDYLTSFYDQSSDLDLEKIDFLITPHLIKGQFIAYNFLNLNSTARVIFRFPGHEKKVMQQLKSLVNRFENNQKRKKKISIHQEILQILKNEVDYLMQTSSAINLSIKEIKSQNALNNQLEDLFKSPLTESDFPLDHI